MTDGSKPPSDHTIRVTWKTLPIVLVFIAVLVVFGAGSPSLNRIVARIIGYGVVGLIAVALAILAFNVIRPHRADRIAKLLSAGREREAYELSLQLIQAYPDDPIVRFNAGAAMCRTGRTEEARELFNSIDPKKLPRFLRGALENWKATVNP